MTTNHLKSILIIVSIGLIIFASYIFWDQSKELHAYELVNREGGVVMIAPDGKKFISFRLRVEMKTQDSPQLKEALAAIPWITDLRGINIDQIPGLTPEHIAPLARIKTLEQLNACETGLTYRDTEFLQRYGAPGLKIIIEWPKAESRQ